MKTHLFFYPEDPEMPTVKITTKHQVTIPTDVFKRLELSVGDILEASDVDGKIVMVPKRLTDRVPAVRLSVREQKVLESAQDKIERINSDPLNSTGLTKSEIKVAVKAGFIEADQSWWWTEKSQKGYRESMREAEEGGHGEAFSSMKELTAHLLTE